MAASQFCLMPLLLLLWLLLLLLFHFWFLLLFHSPTQVRCLSLLFRQCQMRQFSHGFHAQPTFTMTIQNFYWPLVEFMAKSASFWPTWVARLLLVVCRQQSAPQLTHKYMSIYIDMSIMYYAYIACLSKLTMDLDFGCGRAVRHALLQSFRLLRNYARFQLAEQAAITAAANRSSSKEVQVHVEGRARTDRDQHLFAQIK